MRLGAKAPFDCIAKRRTLAHIDRIQETVAPHPGHGGSGDAADRNGGKEAET
jgi:hypothetical protein